MNEQQGLYKSYKYDTLPSKIACRVNNLGFVKLLKQKYMLSLSLEQIAEFNKRRYEKLTGTKLDYEHPKNICEKAQQIKIYDAQPYKTQWADKRLAKELAEKLIGKEHIIRTLGVWNSFDEIDFDTLPDSFVLKTNHSSGWNLIVNDKSKLDKARAKKKFDLWMKLNYGASERCELHYRKIKPCIIAEEMLRPKNGKLIDYKITFINGELIKINFMDKRNKTIMAFYFDENEQLVLRHATETMDIPENLDELLSIAKKLSRDISIVRVDLYDVDGKIYFGELTFTPSAFLDNWQRLEKWDHLSEKARAYARTGLPEHITQL